MASAPIKDGPMSDDPNGPPQSGPPPVVPPPYGAVPPPYGAAPPPYGAMPPPMQGMPPPPPPMPSIDRVYAAWQRRPESDYIFRYWTALGWTVLTVGIYGLYILYQLVRRMRDHNVRRLERFDASIAFAWEQAGKRGLQDEVRTQ